MPRKKLTKRITIALAAVVGAALAMSCSDSAETPVGPIASPSFEISDAAHAGREHFFFLPPMVPDPSAEFSAAFDGTLLDHMTVAICEWTGSGCVEPLLAEFTSQTGPGSETLRVNTTDEYYIIN